MITRLKQQGTTVGMTAMMQWATGDQRRHASLALLLGASHGASRSGRRFYRGKTVNVYIGVGVGGEYDIQARLVARHIGKHIPGNPDRGAAEHDRRRRA